MSRNNDDRLGAAPDAAPPPIQVEETAPVTANTNPLGQGSNGLNFVIPTEFVDLPSRGSFYAEGHPLRGAGTVEIKHMTAREEEILTSRTLLKKGIALDRLIDSVLVDKRINSSALLVGDKNAILVASRVLAYGREYETTVTCPSCLSKSQFSFDLMDSKVSHPDDVESPLFEKTENGTFTFILPKTQVKAEVRLLTGTDEAMLSRTLERRKKMKNGTDSLLSEQMRTFIVSLNGVTDKKLVNDFINHMPAADARYTRKVYADIAPNLDLTQHFACLECDHETEMEVPFTADFFWPK
jgi:hypothetical protein